MLKDSNRTTIKKLPVIRNRRGDGTSENKERKAELPKTEEKVELEAPAEKKELGHQDQKMLEGGRIKELEERLMRMQAEFENYKKRAARENEMIRESAAAEAMLKLLPIVDDFEIAISHMDHSTHKEFKQGMELVFSKLLDMLKREGVEQMKALGESFDPYKHDAIRQGEGENGKIVEVVQRGYSFKGKILRHAKVVVGKGKEG